MFWSPSPTSLWYLSANLCKKKKNNKIKKFAQLITGWEKKCTPSLTHILLKNFPNIPFPLHPSCPSLRILAQCKRRKFEQFWQQRGVTQRKYNDHDLPKMLTLPSLILSPGMAFTECEFKGCGTVKQNRAFFLGSHKIRLDCRVELTL